MRLLSLLTRFATILVAQQLISTWFLFDFFVTRDSLVVGNFWKKSATNGTEQASQILEFASTVEHVQCSDKPTHNEASFDKLVFIVIDALGSQFITMLDSPWQQHGNKTDTMPFVMNSLRQQTAMGFVARAATPTVTMPRVKAILSGTIPSFLDVVHNLASDVSKFDDDNIIRVAKNQNKTLVFYGDDTWLSLFRKNIFARAQETHSFFANDYTTVDTNVTEKALPETSAETIDWDFLLLHYLGLDHIGHVFGSNDNSLIRDKLGEMDRVIEQIHNNMAKKDHKTLVVICGDHGMSKEGNHGGGSDLEANTAVIFLPIGRGFEGSLGKSNISYPHVKQIDVAATLSLVLGLNIPSMSKGVAIEPFLDALWSGEAGRSKLACAYLSNLIQLAGLVDVRDFDAIAESENLPQTLKDQLNSNGDLRTIARNYHTVSRRIQQVLLDTIASRSYPYLLTSLLILVTILTIFSLRRTSLRLLLPTISKIEHLICSAILLMPIILLGSTDFIEFEHKFWPIFSTVSFVLLCCVQKNLLKLISTLDPIRSSLFIATALITSLRIFTPSTEHELSSTSDYFPSILSVIMLCNFLRQNSDVKKYRGPLAILIGLVILVTKHMEESRATKDQPSDVAICALSQNLATLVVIVYITIEIVATRHSLDERESEGIGPVALIIRKLASGWMCVNFLLVRRRDFVFLISNVIMEASLNSICKSLKLSLIARALIYFNFAQAAFFNQGNSNSFSSIDVMPAFFGQTTYNIFLSIPLVAIATYSTQIYWLTKLFQRIQDDKTTSITESQAQLITTRDSAESSVKLIRNSIVMRNFLSQSYYMFVCMWLRNHLFIWSVLSPKLIYQFVTSGVVLTCVLVISSLSNLQRLSIRESSTKSQDPATRKLDTSVL